MKSYFTKIVLIFSLLLTWSSCFAIGLMPVPDIKNTNMSAVVTKDEQTGLFTYNYSVTSGQNNIGLIRQISFDMVFKGSRYGSGYGSGYDNGLTIPMGTVVKTFPQALAEVSPLNLSPTSRIIPFGQTMPTDWSGGIDRSGFGLFSALKKQAAIYPGTSKTFAFHTYTLPTIRRVEIKPDWVLLVENHNEVTEFDRLAALEVQKSITIELETLGPLQPNVGFPLSRIEKDTIKSISLGWFSDAALGNSIVSEFELSRIAYLQGDGTTAKKHLQVIFDSIINSDLTQRSQEAHDLIYFNVQWLLGYIPDTTYPVKTEYEISPISTNNILGNNQDIQVRIFNSLHNNDPIQGESIIFVIASGPHIGLEQFSRSDQNGIAKLSYKGERQGRDVIEIWIFDGEEKLGEVEVLWSGGPDMVVTVFTPPLLKTVSGNPILVRDITGNIGNVRSGESITRYYLSNTENPDPETSIVIGERLVPALDPDKLTVMSKLTFTAPPNLVDGIYYMAACADANNQIIETNETNNCSYNILEKYGSLVVALVPLAKNPLVCDNASASKTTLWPPNHKLQEITITGVTNPNDDSSSGSSSSHNSSSSHDTSSNSSHDSSSGSGTNHGSNSSHDSSSSSSHDSSSSSNSSSDSEDDSGDDSSSSSDSEDDSSDDITIKITSIQQDEPVNGLGDGDTSPDGFGVGTSVALVRAERSGLENGRIYIIGFKATNEAGASCSGSVTVGVPHDKKSTPIDSGARYDSTQQ